MSLNIINWGIIGCGDVAEVKSGPAFQKVKNSTLIAVMRRNETKVKDFAKKHQVPHWTTDASKIINNPEVNAIYIATPPSSHLSYALQALKAGKHVYLEKPMVLNTSEAEMLTKAVNQSQAKLTVAHYRRNLPVFVKVKELIDARVIGTIRSAEIKIAQSADANLIAKSDENWRLNPEVSGGGYFHDIAPHQIDLMYYYFGEIDAIKGVFEEREIASNDVVKGEIIFKNSVHFSGTWNFVAIKDSDSCIIHGEKGSITFSFYGDEIHVISNGNKESYTFKNPKHVQQPMIASVVSYFLGEGENPCSVKEGMAVIKIMDTFCGIV